MPEDREKILAQMRKLSPSYARVIHLDEPLIDFYDSLGIDEVSNKKEFVQNCKKTIVSNCTLKIIDDILIEKLKKSNYQNEDRPNIILDELSKTQMERLKSIGGMLIKLEGKGASANASAGDASDYGDVVADYTINLNESEQKIIKGLRLILRKNNINVISSGIKINMSSDNFVLLLLLMAFVMVLLIAYGSGKANRPE